MKNQKKRIRSAILFIIITLMISGIMPYSYIDYYININAKTIDESETALKAIEDQLSKIQQAIKDNEQKLNSREKDLLNEMQTKNLLDESVQLAQEELQKQNELLIQINNSIREKEADITGLEADIDNKYEVFLECLKSAYKEGNVNILGVIFSSENLPEFIMNVHHAGSLLNYQQKLMTELNEKSVELKIAQEELDVSNQRALEKKEELKNKEAELLKKADKSANYIDNYRKEMKTIDNEIDQGYLDLERANQDFEAAIKELERLKEAQKKQTYYTGTGELAWPASAKNNKVSSEFGNRFFNGRTETHRGIDIPVGFGDPVYAAAAGKVVYATYHNSYGNYVMIDHGLREDGSSLYTLYAHNSKLNVKVDDYVEEGQKIAEGGSTGYSFGNHIHFEVRINGVTVDPRGYVSPP